MLPGSLVLSRNTAVPRPQRVRHHLRRPLAGRRDLLMETASTSVATQFGFRTAEPDAVGRGRRPRGTA